MRRVVQESPSPLPSYATVLHQNRSIGKLSRPCAWLLFCHVSKDRNAWCSTKSLLLLPDWAGNKVLEQAETSEACPGG